MPDHLFLVRLRSHAIQHVRAARVEIHGERLAFLTSEETLAALFLFSVVESWSEIETARNPP